MEKDSLWTLSPQPLLQRWHQERLKHSIELLEESQRVAVVCEVQRLAAFRGWNLWGCAARTNHVHVVLTAAKVAGSTVRDQLKANCTRVLREHWPKFVGRPCWTVGGDWQCLNNEEDLEMAVLYVTQAQDRMGLGK